MEREIPAGYELIQNYHYVNNVRLCLHESKVGLDGLPDAIRGMLGRMHGEN